MRIIGLIINLIKLINHINFINLITLLQPSPQFEHHETPFTIDFSGLADA
jgi:hypothetical protein